MKLGLVSLFLVACSSTPSPKAASYSVELEECNRKATTCAESIACENDVRARYKRPLRTGDCK